MHDRNATPDLSHKKFSQLHHLQTLQVNNAPDKHPQPYDASASWKEGQ